MKVPCYLPSVIIFSLLFNSLYCFSQSNSVQDKKYIQELIDQDSIVEAKLELTKQLNHFRELKNADSLVTYTFLVGSFKLADNDPKKAVDKVLEFGKELKRYTSDFVNKEFLMEMAWIYDDAGFPEKAYTSCEEALEIAKNIADPKKAGIDVIYHNLGYQASNLGDYALAKKHYNKAIKIMKSAASLDYESLHKTYNALGGMMWYSAKLDSSKYYFSEALKMLENLDSNEPIDLHYRPALVKLNLAVLSQATGRIDEAIRMSEEVVDGFQSYINISTDESRKLRALKHQLSAIDNLGSFYHSIGEFERADELINYSYQRKLKNLAPEDHNITISQIISAQAKSARREFEDANKIIDQALKRIENSSNMQLYWHAGALSAKAHISYQLKDTLNALKYRKASNKLYRKALGKGDYNREFLDDLILTSLLHADLNNSEEAIKTAKETYNFVKSSDFKNNIQGFHHTLNLAEVYYKLEDYQNAIKYSDEALDLFSKLTTKSNMDSIQIQYRKPKAIHINARSKYNIEENKNEEFLKELLQNMKNGLEILEQRKTQIKSFDDLSLLIAENNNLFNFSKKLLLDLFALTKDKTYLEEALSYHESALYNRIRSRLNLKTNIAFQGIPQEVIEDEKTLRRELNAAIDNSKDGSLEDFFEANIKWENYLSSIEKKYPKYYKMRYASIQEPLGDIEAQIPENTTVIRYLFVDDELYAITISKGSTSIFQLDFKSVKHLIASLTETSNNTINHIGQAYFELYNALWKPLNNTIVGSKVIIIPDGEMFNLSFEVLSPIKTNSFKELSSTCLLNTYSISYNYSLFLLNEDYKSVDYSNEFIAFAPEFNDKMKEEYKLNINDSIHLDNTYLTLLPQPNSVDLAKEFSKVFNGSYFTNNQATKQIFTEEANEHKIIHIGTHAESNNISPELSRLVFAKSNKNSTSINDNYLYTYEIYNQNLNSELAILTACETGKPTYQAGEGMISLAHAFNYAGSESILTSLWQIDETSSTAIIKSFYNNLSEGQTKDDALRNAKLDYIAVAEGRTISPQYWAGLVLIGDASPIELKSNGLWWIWALAVVFMLSLLVYFLRLAFFNSSNK